MLRNSFGDLLGGKATTLKALHEELAFEQQLVTVNNAKDKGVLILAPEGVNDGCELQHKIVPHIFEVVQV